MREPSENDLLIIHKMGREALKELYKSELPHVTSKYQNFKFSIMAKHSHITVFFDENSHNPSHDDLTAQATYDKIKKELRTVANIWLIQDCVDQILVAEKLGAFDEVE